MPTCSITLSAQVFAASRSFGSVPLRNHSSIALLEVERRPVHGSIATFVSPPAGCANFVTGHLRYASSRKPCQT